MINNWIWLEVVLEHFLKVVIDLFEWILSYALNAGCYYNRLKTTLLLKAQLPSNKILAHMSCLLLVLAWESYLFQKMHKQSIEKHEKIHHRG